jgi:DNA mismatch endonuclease, patch repair protein
MSITPSKPMGHPQRRSHDRLTAAERSAVMGRIRSADTQPELYVRRLLHRAGFRYTLHDPLLPGTPDIIFPKLRCAIFVHGCFWHRHRCHKGRSVPTAHREFWLRKFAANEKRDRVTVRKVRKLGWKPIVVWQCQLSDPNRLLKRLEVALCSN